MIHPENSEEYKGLTVNSGVTQQATVNPYLNRMRFRRRQLSVADMVCLQFKSLLSTVV